jgi:hypothetical protein
LTIILTVGQILFLSSHNLDLLAVFAAEYNTLQGSRSGNAHMTFGMQDMAETRRVERTRTGGEAKRTKSILKPGMQTGW